MAYIFIINETPIVKIAEDNIEVHKDIAEDIEKAKDGLFTFTLRVNAGNIVDYVRIKNIEPKRFDKFESIDIQELSITRQPGGAG